MTGLSRLRTDFNDLSDDMATVLLETLNGMLPSVGDVVLLYDADGNVCRGEVAEIDAGLIYVEPDWDSWVESNQVEIGPTADLMKALQDSVQRARVGDDDAKTEGFAEDLNKIPA